MTQTYPLPLINSRVKVDQDVAVMKMEEPVDEDGPLQAEGRDHEVEAYRAKTVALQEHHQEAETDEDHDVDILEH